MSLPAEEVTQFGSVTLFEVNIDDKWKLVKRTGLCYRCLGEDHLGSSCPRSRQCNINGCKETNNRLLHGQRGVNVKGPIQDGNLARKPPIKQMES